MPRPCPFVSCRHHLLLDVERRRGAESGLVRAVGVPGTVRQDTALPEGWEDAVVERLEGMGASCALDVAEGGAMNTEEVAAVLGVTRQRVHQVEREAVRVLARRASLRVLVG